MLPRDVADSRPAMLEIRAGTGGDEAALFAADLYRMYERYAADQGWRVEPVSVNASDIGGFKEIVAHISGWHREMIPALERLARGERPIPEGVSYDDVDAWNAKFAAARKSAPTADILKELDASHAAFMQAAAAVAEDRYVPGKTAHKIVDFNSRHHYHEHREQIEAWRKRAGA